MCDRKGITVSGHSIREEVPFFSLSRVMYIYNSRRSYEYNFTYDIYIYIYMYTCVCVGVFVCVFYICVCIIVMQLTQRLADNYHMIIFNIVTPLLESKRRKKKTK